MGISDLKIIEKMDSIATLTAHFHLIIHLHCQSDFSQKVRFNLLWFSFASWDRNHALERIQ
jgi:hypothetical protein